MNIQRFLAPTAREALAKARLAFGDGTLILSNRQTPHGVEVMATTEDALAALDEAAPKTQAATTAAAPTAARAATPAAPTAMPRASAHTPVEEDAAQLAMSTLSFQEYVRERMLQRRQEALQAKSAPAARPAYEVIPPDAQAAPVRAAAPAAKPITVPPTPAPAPAPAALPQGLVSELNAMKELIEERFGTLAWLGQTQQNPIRANLTLKLIRAGYSPALARAVLSMLPDDASPAEAMHWLLGVLQRNIKTDAGGPALHEEGGVFALVGTTGVGKTTTAAKLAAQCVKQHGAGSVGMITLDTYRVSGYEQLRTYGRMLGVVAHLAHDRAALVDLLNLLQGKRMVIIDTAGLGQRDQRIQEMLDVLAMPSVKKMLVLNAGSQGDTLDEVLTSFKAAQLHGVVLSKVDEAVKLGPAIDALVRHQVVLRGVANGQRVPEDWQTPDAASLVRLSMGSQGKSVHDPMVNDLGFYFAQSSQAVQLGAAHV